MTGLLRKARNWVDLEQQTLQRAIESSVSCARGRLLDVGCGDKPYEQVFRTTVSEYVGIDFAPTYEGSENASRNRADVLYTGDTFPFQDGEFDTILCTQVLEHTARPDLVLAECVRVLKPGGCLILTVPFSFRIHSEPHDFFRYTKFGLASLIESSGAVVERLEPRGGLWMVVGQKVASYLAIRMGRMGSTLQEAGGLTYEQAIRSRPRYWALPVVVPAIFIVIAASRLLEWLDSDKTDTLGYLAIARRLG